MKTINLSRRCRLAATLGHFVQHFLPIPAESASVDGVNSMSSDWQPEMAAAATIPLLSIDNFPNRPALLCHLEELLLNGSEMEEQSCIFVDALTWTSHSLRANRPYLLELEICDLDAQLSHVQRTAFIRPLPIGKRSVQLAVASPLFIFNVFRSASIFGNQFMGSLRLESFSCLEFESLEMAPTVHIRRVEDAADQKQASDWLENPMEPDEAIKAFFEQPKLLHDGDFFTIPISRHRKLLYKAHFPAIPAITAIPATISSVIQSPQRNVSTAPKLSTSEAIASAKTIAIAAKFVQRGQTNCLALVGRVESAGRQNAHHFPARHPQLFPGSAAGKSMAHQQQLRPFLPKPIRSLAHQMARLLWPMFDWPQNQPKLALPRNQLLLLQTGSVEAATLLVEELALRLDVRVRVLDCLLELWQERNGLMGGLARKTLTNKVDSNFRDVEASAPCICWIQEVAALFPTEMAASKEEMDVLQRALAARLRPNLGNNSSKPDAHKSANSILFIISCSPAERLEIPERLRKLLHWQFALEGGDERLDTVERTALLRHRSLTAPFNYRGPDLVKTVTEQTRGLTLLGLRRLISDAECQAICEHQMKNAKKNGRRQLPAVGIQHFQAAVRRSAPQSGTKSRVELADVGGLEEAKRLLHDALGQLVRQSERRAADGEKGDQGNPFFDLRRRTGILLYGPPGCGKTLLAKAVANEFGLAFHNVKGPELLSQYVGESERNLRQLFAQARQMAPAVIFFDELDSLAPSRGAGNDSGGVMDRMVSQLITELDGCQWNWRKPVFVMGATNRPDLIDACLLTPGRFDKLVPVRPATDVESKLAILRPLCKNVQLAEGFHIEEIAKQCPEAMSGAELAGLVRSATMNRIREIIAKLEGNGANTNTTSEEAVDEMDEIVLSREHFEQAL